MAKITLKVAFQLGLQAARNGRSSKANPFGSEAPLFESWTAGWEMEKDLGGVPDVA